MPVLLRRFAALSVPVLLAGALLSVPAAGQAAIARPAAARAAAARAGVAASSPRWRIVKVYGPKANGGGQLMSVDAAGAKDAWLAGVVGTDEGPPAPLVAHWNGSRWRAAPTPPGMSATAPMVQADVAASSASDAWLFAELGADTPYSLALGWNGSRWARFRFPNWSAIAASAVFSRTNAWAFGQVFLGKVGPYVARYNGKRWHGMSVPLAPQSASAVSASDIWASGQTTRSLGTRSPAFAAMHWNGKSWHAVPFPKLRLPRGVVVNQTFIQAFGPASAWVIVGLAKGEGVYPGDVLLHWTGKWHQVKVPFPTAQVAGITQDGHGGIWISAYSAGPKFQAVLYHERGGHWSRQPAPTEPGETTQLNALSWSSGAKSGWAAGEVLPGDGTSRGVLLQYAR